MDILLARKEITSKPRKSSFDKLVEILEKDDGEIIYLDRENSHKDMIAIVEKFENIGYSVHFKEVKYGLADDEYLYQIHLL